MAPTDPLATVARASSGLFFRKLTTKIDARKQGMLLGRAQQLLSHNVFRVLFSFVCLSPTVGLGRLSRLESAKAAHLGAQTTGHAPITDKTTQEP